MTFLPDSFETFISPKCDRKQFILDTLTKEGINCGVVPLGDSRHILVNFPLSSYNPMFKTKTVIAHYDRVESSPGANDNSAACFQIMDWAVKLSKMDAPHNVRIFFTDGEELGANGGVVEQGAYGIAAKFRNLGILNDDVYVFDCCGRGNIPVISMAGKGVGGESFQKKFDTLVAKTENLLRTVSPQKWLSLPVPYSDNAAFLACGIPAVALTILPSEEATLYMESVQKTPNNTAQSFTPMTWQLLHTPQDDISTLTPEAFALMAAILDAIAASKSLV